MHARLREIFDRSTSRRAEFERLIAGVPEDRWSKTLPSGGWSVGEVAGHVQIVDAGSLRAMFRALRDARAAGLRAETEASSVADSMDRYAIATSPEKRAAPSFTIPDPVPEKAAVLESLRKTTDGLQIWGGEADGCALGDVHFPHAAFGTINLYQWLIFLGEHSERHRRQALSILEHP
ncbi:MAG: DinB family protein [Gemmatimonadota bacterium]